MDQRCGGEQGVVGEGRLRQLIAATTLQDFPDRNC
jgi:hypothetical protein